MIEEKRQAEIAQYVKEYQNPGYRMGEQRKIDVERLLRSVFPGSLIDIGAGRGETIEIANRLGFCAIGTEAVPTLLNEQITFAEAHKLPFQDQSFDVVTCFDVLEHLIEEDLLPALKEMERVARKNIIISASEVPSIWNGRELHISKRPAKEWESLLSEVFMGKWRWYRRGEAGGSPAWIIGGP